MVSLPAHAAAGANSVPADTTQLANVVLEERSHLTPQLFETAGTRALCALLFVLVLSVVLEGKDSASLLTVKLMFSCQSLVVFCLWDERLNRETLRSW